MLDSLFCECHLRIDPERDPNSRNSSDTIALRGKEGQPMGLLQSAKSRRLPTRDMFYKGHLTRATLLTSLGRTKELEIY